MPSTFHWLQHRNMTVTLKWFKRKLNAVAILSTYDMQYCSKALAIQDSSAACKILYNNLNRVPTVVLWKLTACKCCSTYLLQNVFVLFSFFSRYNFNTNWKKHRWCAWDSNLRPQDGRRRRNHGTMAATNYCKMFDGICYWRSNYGLLHGQGPRGWVAKIAKYLRCKSAYISLLVTAKMRHWISV